MIPMIDLLNQVLWQDLGPQPQQGMEFVSRADLGEGFMAVAGLQKAALPGVSEPITSGTAALFYMTILGPVPVITRVVAVNEAIEVVKQRTEMLWQSMPPLIKDFYAVHNQRMAKMLGLGYETEIGSW